VATGLVHPSYQGKPLDRFFLAFTVGVPADFEICDKSERAGWDYRGWDEMKIKMKNKREEKNAHTYAVG
jgi:hypothetical protein